MVVHSMEKFFSLAGELKVQWTDITGLFPRRSVTAYFVYEHGMASYNGREWTFNIDNEL